MRVSVSAKGGIENGFRARRKKGKRTLGGGGCREISEKGGTARVLTLAPRYGTADVFRLKSALSGFGLGSQLGASDEALSSLFEI